MSNKNLHIIIQLFMQEIEGVHIENQLLLLIIESLVVFLAWVVLRKRNIPLYKYILGFLFLAYSGIVMSITVFRRPVGSREGIVHLFVYLGFGLRTGDPSLRVSAYSVLNILLFVPLGILVYLKSNKDNSLKCIALCTFMGAFISLLIECTQLITGRGMFEITDILTNASGSLIGAILMAVVIGIWNKIVVKKLKV